MSKVGWVAIFSLAMTGCSSTLSLEEREAKREQIDQQSQEIVEQLRDKYPDIEEQINQSEGYVTISMSGVKVPVVGSASGEGVIYSQQENSRTYVEVTRYDLGAGLGAGGYRSLTLFDDIEQLHTVREGSLEMSIGGDWAVSDSSREAELFQGGADLPYTTYLLYDDSTIRRLAL